jgi:hypothetical protein
MPRYYFHIEDGTALVDNEGVELSGPRAARVEAARTIGEMVSQNPDEFWNDGNFKLTVVDEGGSLLFVLNLSAVVPPVFDPYRGA